MIKIWLISSFLLIHSPDGKWQYDLNCCSNQHCKPVPCDEVIDGIDSIVKWDKYTFKGDMIKPSGDAKCHVCINPNGDRPLCVYIQNNT